MIEKTALCIFAEGFEEIEAVTPIDILRRAGVRVTIASLGSELLVCGRNQLKIQAEVSLNEVVNSVYDLLLLPGGAAVQALCEDERVLALTRTHYRQGKWVAAICAAPRILDRAGVLQGQAFTGHQSLEADYPSMLTEEAVVCVDNLITSRGAGTALAFSLEIVKRLMGEALSNSIAQSIHTK